MLVFMVGLQGSGKSYQSKLFQEKFGYRVLNADTYRLSFPESSNDTIFKMLYRDAEEALRNGENVVLDNTNISLKQRSAAVRRFKGKTDKIVAYVMNTPFEVCKSRLAARNASGSQSIVPLEVLDMYLMKFQVPTLGEGFDEIHYHNFYSIEEAKEFGAYCTRLMNKFDQLTPHHNYDLLTHCQKTTQYFVDRLRAENYSKDVIFDLKIGSLFHDIGKVFTQTFDDNGVAHYYNHNNVGAYLICSKGVSPLFSQVAIELINYHMIPFACQRDKTVDKYKLIFGEDLWAILSLFNESDKKGAQN